MNQEIRDLLIRSRIQMLMTMPFFGILALNLQLEECTDIETAGTDGKKFYYNPEFVQKLSEKERNFLVAHEVMHPALKHLWRRNDREHQKWNFACDFAINLLIVDSDPSGNTFQFIKIGCLDRKYEGMSAEEIYDLLPKSNKFSTSGSGKGKPSQGNSGNGQGQGQSSNEQGEEVQGELITDHSTWEKAAAGAQGDIESADWEGKIQTALEAHASKYKGNLPAGLKRLRNVLLKPQKNWKALLNEFIVEQNADYSFNPPDRRYEGDFFLPDFNEVEEEVKDIVFWVDTSGSIGQKELNTVMSEIIGAIQQMDGKLQGYVGFFDAKAYPLNTFESIADVENAPVLGGGGTDFFEPFREVQKQLVDKGHEVAGIIMLTDGYATFPPENITEGIPTLWLITNENIEPPFGVHATVKILQ